MTLELIALLLTSLYVLAWYRWLRGRGWRLNLRAVHVPAELRLIESAERMRMLPPGEARERATNENTGDLPVAGGLSAAARIDLTGGGAIRHRTTAASFALRRLLPGLDRPARHSLYFWLAFQRAVKKV